MRASRSTAPGSHWAVRLASDPHKRAVEHDGQIPLVVAGVPLAPTPLVAWWTPAEIKEARRRKLIRPAPSVGLRCYELGRAERKSRVKRKPEP